MKSHRDTLSERFDKDIGSIVGSALDRIELERPVRQFEVNAALAFYRAHSDAINSYGGVSDRRELIVNFIRDAKVPMQLRPNQS